MIGGGTRKTPEGTALRTCPGWVFHQHPLDDMAPNRLPGLAAPEVEDITGAHSVADGALAWDAAVVAGDSVVLLVPSPGNCRAV
jgi:hypothetical protein